MKEHTREVLIFDYVVPATIMAALGLVALMVADVVMELM